MPFQKISGNFVELSVDNYLGSIKSGSSISDLGFRTYRESVVGVMPVSGTGGNPGISLALNTTNPLSSDADLRLVKDSTNRQGEGFSVDFSIQNRHQSKVLQISFDMELISGIYTNQDLIPKTGTFTVASTTCTVTASHSLVVGQAVNMSFPGGTAPASGLYVITAIVPGVSFSFTIPSGSGSGVSCTWNILSSLRVYIIANPTTNPTIIEPVNTGLQLGIANQKVKHIASFQTNNSGNSYRMVIHITEPGILPYTVDFANFKIWEQQQSLGAVITDWQSYNAIDTPDLNTLPTTREFEWRRVGSNVQIRGRGITNSSSFPAVLAKILIPNGLKFNAMPSMSGDAYNGRFVVGRVNQASSGSTTKNYNLMAVKDTAGNLNNSYLYITPNNDGGGSPSFDQQNWGNLFGYNSTLIFEAEFPIVGWGSNVAMSSDTGDGRVVACLYNGTASATIDSTNGIRFNTLVKDTHASYTSSNGEFTAPVEGYYTYLISGAITTSSFRELFVYVNGSIVQSGGGITTNAATSFAPCSGMIYLLAGQKLTFRLLNPNSDTISGKTNASLAIYRISAGSQQIAATETVACRYEKTDGANVLSTATDMIYNIRTRDTHSAYNTTNGEYTVPISGYYQINCIVGLSTGSLYNIHVLKNGSTTDFTTVGGVTTMNRRNLSTGNYYLAGDKIKIQAIADTTRSTDTSTGANTLFICRLGI